MKHLPPFGVKSTFPKLAGRKKSIFFNTHIRPLIQKNYYRDIGINGKFIDDLVILPTSYFNQKRVVPTSISTTLTKYKRSRDRLLHLSVYQVLPKIQPDIEALLHHKIESILNKLPIYRQMQSVPGLSHLPTEMAEKLAKNISHSLYSPLTTSTVEKILNESYQLRKIA